MLPFFFHSSFLAFIELVDSHWRQMINQIRDAHEEIKWMKKQIIENQIVQIYVWLLFGNIEICVQ